LLADSLLECYVGFSARSSGQGTAADGPVTFDRVLLRLEPQPNVYKGTSPGTGGWWKLDARSPRFVLRDSVFAADQLPNHQDLRPPPAVTCSGNRVLWGGAGAFPETAEWLAACPDTVIVTGQAARDEWKLRATAWLGR